MGLLLLLVKGSDGGGGGGGGGAEGVSAHLVPTGEKIRAIFEKKPIVAYRCPVHCRRCSSRKWFDQLGEVGRSRKIGGV